jgi:hypothetical protein
MAYLGHSFFTSFSPFRHDDYKYRGVSGLLVPIVTSMPLRVHMLFSSLEDSS